MTTPPSRGLRLISTLHPGVEISTVEELNQAFDDLTRLAVQEEVGQSLEMRVSIDEVLVVDIDGPGDRGWALAYDNDDTGTSVESAEPGNDNTDEVTLQWGGNWQEREARCFIDPAVARAAAIEFFESGILSATVTWE